MWANQRAEYKTSVIWLDGTFSLLEVTGTWETYTINYSTTCTESHAHKTAYMQFCAVYIRERHLLNSVLLIKFFVNVRALRKASFIRLTKNYNTVTWFWSKPFSFLISCCFATNTQHLQFVSSFSSTLWWPSMPQMRMIADLVGLEVNELVLEDC